MCTRVPATGSELTTPPTFNCQAALSCCNVYNARRLTYDGAGADVTRIRHTVRGSLNGSRAVGITLVWQEKRALTSAIDGDEA